MNTSYRVELHCHSCFSPDSLVRLKDLLSTCRQKGIDRVAITDHGTMAGALLAKELDPEMVILGEEIETTQGELLGYFMTEEIPQGLPPQEVVARLRSQGAFISVAHPFDPNRGSHWQPGQLEALLPDLDGIEVFNARCVREAYNEKARLFAERNHKAGLAGSDAHSLKELGKATLILPPFDSAASLRSALPEARVEGSLSSSAVHLLSTYAKAAKKITRCR